MNKYFILCMSIVATLTGITKIQANENYAIEVHTFWQTEGELEALDVLVRNLAKSNIDVQIVNHEDYNTLRYQISRRIGSSYPPELSHWIGGEDLNKIASAGPVLSLSKKDHNDMLSKIYSEVWDEVSFEGNMVAIPVGIHLQSMVIYNATLIDPVWKKPFPDNWQDFLTMTAELEQAGIDPYSGVDTLWVIREVFSGIMTSIGSLEALQNIYDDFDEDSKLRAQLSESFEYFLKLRDYTADDDTEKGWSEMVKKVIDGQSAFTIIGDFAWSEIKTYAADSMEEFHCAPLPGIPTAYYGIDIFLAFDASGSQWRDAFPKVTEIVLSPENQTEYLSYKGGLPVTSNVDSTTLNRCSQVSLQRWNSDPKQRFSTPGPRDDRRIGFVNSALEKIWSDREITVEAATDLFYESIKQSY